ncbi:hypothetical protein [Rhizobium leguminosarum]|uniref:Uncharacterized protein n=1 Tax=Rhizobium leguminosarum TaxID=384 RepID=A0A1B1CKW5_RHILE|nr:hypothetical protein [Rhizobium leguminosarum]ANP90388.1 hypothetical protein BA011_31045 [Rhizobium leguminosarum]
MAFVVHVEIPYTYEELSIYDEAASSPCEDNEGQIIGRNGANKTYTFSVKEEKKSKPPGLITVTATIVAAGTGTVTTVTYPIAKTGQQFVFPNQPDKTTAEAILEHETFQSFVDAINSVRQAVATKQPSLPPDRGTQPKKQRQSKAS